MCTLVNHIIDYILGQALHGYSGVRVGTNVHVTGFAYANDIVLLSNRQRVMQDLLEMVKSHAATVGMGINASKTKVMSALIPGV